MRNQAIRVDNNGNILMPTIDETFFDNYLGAGSGMVDINAESSVQLFPLGTKVVQGDRTFRYAKNGAVALTAGTLITSAARGADHIKDLAVLAAAVGNTTITVTNGASTAVTADMFAGGYLFVNDCGAATGEGQCLRIKSNTAAAVNVAFDVVVYDPLVIALTTASQVGISKNPYDMVVISASTPVANVVGVCRIPVTIAYFFWLQTGGPAAVLCNGTHVVGKPVEVGLTTAGSADVGAGTTGADAIGICMAVAASTEFSLVFLTIDN